MNQCKLILLSIILLGYLGTAFAECEEPASQLEIIACLSKIRQDADNKLNSVYQSVLENSDKERKDLIRKSQRAWIAFRDTNCAAYYDMSRVKDNPRHGSMAGQLREECLLKMTKERTAELDSIEPME